MALGVAPIVGAITPLQASDQAAPPESATRATLELVTPLGLTTDGRSLTRADLPGCALIVCFWASWCPHCRAELPVLEQIQRSVSTEQLRVLLVNTEPAADWRRVQRQLEGKLRALLTHDPDGQVRKAFTAPDSVPHTVVVGRGGQRQATLTGWSEERLDWLVGHANAALAAPAAPIR